ncbi:uncharacterized protein LOC123548705 isoform X2 [Mercenaria mercenaria]|uniref:uncharacterized protein LOC123548705 isoform X2 n=1 Tax=Mercenaria mercenaria TaxID=6596 RepID=UPI00234EE0AC|nr:uncharacterized protein LOC123548705 isoform X2 [Mercenaria mercenaria]
MQVEPLDLCYSQPNLYRLCDRVICIPWDKKCLETQTRAVTENLSKVNSSVEEGLPIPVVVTIASVCVFVCILMAILLYIFITRRQKNNTSRESQSAKEPLRTSYITPGIEAAPLYSKSNEMSKGKTDSSRKLKPTHYLPVNSECNDNYFQVNNHEQTYEGNYLKTDDSGNSHDNCRRNLAINPGVEIYSNESRVHGLGKYTFKPRLKYMNSKPYNEMEEKDRDKLYVINSYKHCSGKSVLPSTLTFDKDPEKFSNKFATDLLCSSTPRQPAKHFVQNGVAGSLESITAQSDIAIT